MSKLDTRENKRKKSFVKSVIKDNPYKNKKNFKQRSYYLTEDLLKAITIKTAEGILDKSGVVREALKLYLKDILKDL